MSRHLVIDIDGTIGEFTRAAAKCVCWMADEPPQRIHEALVVCESEWAGPTIACDLFGVDREMFWWTIFTERWMNEMEPVVGAALELNALFADGWTVSYRTARPKQSRHIIEQWLYRNGFPNASNVTCENAEAKLTHCLAMMAEGHEVVFIDDCPSTVVAAATSGIPILCPVHPYNADVLRPPVVPLPSWCLVHNALKEVSRAGQHTAP